MARESRMKKLKRLYLQFFCGNCFLINNIFYNKPCPIIVNQMDLNHICYVMKLIILHRYVIFGQLQDYLLKPVYLKDN